MTTESGQPDMGTGLTATELATLEDHVAEPEESSTMVPVEATMTVRDLSAWYGTRRVIRDVTLDFRSNAITAIIGPSGSGKSTLLRCLDRMHEVVPGARSSGEVDLPRGGYLWRGRRAGRGSPDDRHGLPAAQPVPDDVDLRQRGGTGPIQRPGQGKGGADELVERCLPPGSPVG